VAGGEHRSDKKMLSLERYGKAFEAARRAGRPSVECYRAGVAAWRREHPDQAAEYSAKQAAAVILARHVTLLIED
jgi:hypothetical protein